MAPSRRAAAGLTVAQAPAVGAAAAASRANPGQVDELPAELADGARAAAVWQPSELLLPWGSGRGEVGYVPAAEERAAFGPRSLACGVAGDLWLLDAVNERLVHLAADGSWVGSLPAPPAADDLAVGPAGRLYVLSVAHRRLSVLGADGALQVERALPPAPRRVRGLVVDARGHVLLLNALQETFDLGVVGRWTRWPELLLSKAEGLPTPGTSLRSQTLLRDGNAHLLRPDPSGAKEPAAVALEGAAELASVELVGTLVDGGAVVALERFTTPPGVGPLPPVERTLAWFDAAGRLLGRRSLASQPGYLPWRRLALHADGRVHEMVATAKGLQLLVHGVEVQP